MIFFDPGSILPFNATNFQTIQNNKNAQLLSNKLANLSLQNKDIIFECQAIYSAIQEIENHIKFGKDLPCPYCAQLISKDALVCNYCQGSLSIGNAAYIRVAITAKPYLVARDSATIKELMVEIARIDAEQQELQKIIAAIEQEKKEEDLRKQIEFDRHLAQAEKMKIVELKHKKELEAASKEQKYQENITQIKKLISLSTSKIRKAEKYLRAGDVNEFGNYAFKEFSDFDGRLSDASVEKFLLETSLDSKSGKELAFVICHEIRFNWLWFVFVGRILDKYDSQDAWTSVQIEVEKILEKDNIDLKSRDYLSTELRTKFCILQALTFMKLGEHRKAKKRMKNIDSDFANHFQKNFQNDFNTAKGKSEAFYNDLLRVFFL
jgi:hypothetical protein